MTSPLLADHLAGRRLWWWEDAECRGMDPNLFFPERGDDTTEVKAICAGCPVRLECGSYAIEHNEHHGIWGGASERQRRQIRRRLGYRDVVGGRDE